MDIIQCYFHPPCHHSNSYKVSYAYLIQQQIHNVTKSQTRTSPCLPSSLNHLPLSLSQNNFPPLPAACSMKNLLAQPILFTALRPSDRSGTSGPLPTL